MRNKKKPKKQKRAKYYHLTKLVRVAFWIKAERNLQLRLFKISYQGSFVTEVFF